MTDIIRYQIQPKEIYIDGFDWDLPVEEPQATYTNKDAARQLTINAASTSLITLDTGLSTWNSFEMISDKALTLVFYDGVTPAGTYASTTYVNIISETNSKTMKVSNLSGEAAIVSWKFYG